jgi:hypothetical protein
LKEFTEVTGRRCGLLALCEEILEIGRKSATCREVAIAETHIDATVYVFTPIAGRLQ